MTTQDILIAIRKIEVRVDDDEMAHTLEDELYIAFINYIAVASIDPTLRDMARLVLTTRDLDFARWVS